HHAVSLYSSVTFQPSSQRGLFSPFCCNSRQLLTKKSRPIHNRLTLSRYFRYVKGLALPLASSRQYNDNCYHSSGL
ncbi:hypothetical protein, partial [Cronobacter condimenti]|uniref:hypothetical protein n=1 Tax=Cronobacter condimenti TaxID=1163710 RepID=UPI001D0580A3